MKVLLLAAVLLGLALAEDAADDLGARINRGFETWLEEASKDKRFILNYPDGWGNSICTNSINCCDGNKCAPGSECTTEGPKAEKFGYSCKGPNCGPKSGKKSGVLCNQDYDTACDACKKNHPEMNQCYASDQTLSGYMCYFVEGENWNLLNKREVAYFYGDGAVSAMERIARKESEKVGNSSGKLLKLLRELLDSK